ncbi:interleukin-13 receptor subunit alpha-2 isoform X1 [Sphaeramia orbicularis]|uniref:Type I cytokine receptor cytokine-binding domain-containing protein n=1 Tax=Sphaeramia orbicularis TaxID=375764 RepID=A0A672ZAG7_9TELE|nr:interleukin-13 receptor subunit alpha-2 isoform X1 [Sphaeramia orbicularis]
MANTCGFTNQATLMLLLLSWRGMHCKVDPPEDLVITDLGHLGQLEIKWSPPASLINKTECPQQYQLEYFNTYKNRWTGIRTSERSYSAQFDLMKEVKVRVYTLLSGPCTSGSLVKSTNYTEVIQKPPATGVEGTAIKEFICVYHNMEYVTCNWKRSSKMPATAEQNLYYWHKGLEQTEECPKYIISNNIKIGCDFSGINLPDFSDITFCVNGSSPEGRLKPIYTTLQIQNHVKPQTVEKLDLQTDPGTELELQWKSPAGRVPAHCLEWEIEASREGLDGKNTLQQILTDEPELTLPIHDNERSCVRVRSKMNKYCADKYFWSDWSPPTCYPEMKSTLPEAEQDMVSVYAYMAVAIITTLALCVCVWAGLKARRSREVKKLNSVFTTLLDKNPAVADRGI